MPYNDPDNTDPMLLNRVTIETDDDRMADMAACFIEEYLRMGFDGDRVLDIFRTRGYAGPHMAFEALGERRIRAMIGDQIRLRGGRPPIDQHKPLRPAGRDADDIERNERGDIALPVLDI